MFLIWYELGKWRDPSISLQHLVGVKMDIDPCKLIPPDVRFWMENSLQEFVKSKKATQEAYECENPYGPNVSQFQGDMLEGEEEVQ